MESSTETLLQEYISQLNEKEQAAYEIAVEYLGSSFDLEKSIGFQKWIKKKAK
jgi:hypothetical protein|tara:strand:+ start:375 stop:533 length:159 start_codon:yes stop_codon:yes gene_type:complete